jgi:hypothetical protein
MGVLRFVVAACILGLITLEGLNTTAALEAQKQATDLVVHIGTHFKLNPAHLKAVTDNLHYLKFVALSAFAALVIRFHAFFLALYVILTRADQICKKWSPIQKAIAAKGPIEAANSTFSELTYILTNVAIVAYLLSFCCSGCSSSQACAAPQTQKGTHTVHK